VIESRSEHCKCQCGAGDRLRAGIERAAVSLGQAPRCQDRRRRARDRLRSDDGLVGGTSGSGVILLSLLMAAGLEGAAVIATDAAVSLVTSVIKISVFGLAGVVTPQVLAFAVLIGVVALPGAFLARAFVERMPVHIHTAILDVAVIAGGVVMISSALRSLI